MDEISAKSKANNWIAFAAEEFRQARRRWHLTSDRAFSNATGIDARTLRKLNPKHLDGSLEKETFDYIMATLLYLCPCYFESKEEREEEEKRLKESMVLVSLHVRPLHPKAVATYNREMQSIHQAEEDKKGNPSERLPWA